MSFGNSNHPRNSIMKQGSVTEAFFSKNKVTKARIRELDQVPRHKKLIRKTSENQRQFWARKIRTWRRRRVRITRDLVGQFYTGQTPQAAWEYPDLGPGPPGAVKRPSLFSQ